MGLLDSISNAIFGGPTPTYQAPQPYQVPGGSYRQTSGSMSPPMYQANPGATATSSRLQQLLEGQFNQLQGQPLINGNITGTDLTNTALPTLPDNVSNAIIGTATRNANYAADQSDSRLNEQLNSMGLLGSTAQGRGLGEIERSRQDQIGQANDQVTQQNFAYQEQQRQNQLTQRSQQLQEQGQGLQQQQNISSNAGQLIGLLNQQARDTQQGNLAGAQFGESSAANAYNTNASNALSAYNTNANQGYKQYQSQVTANNDQTARNGNLLSTLVGGYGLLSGAGGYGGGYRPSSGYGGNVSGMAGSPQSLMDILKWSY